MFFIFAFGIWALASVYTAWRLMSPLTLSTAEVFLAVLGVLIFILLPFWHWRLARRFEASIVGRISAWVTFLGMGVLNYLCLFLLVRDALWLGARLITQIVSLAYGQVNVYTNFAFAVPGDWWLRSNLFVLALTGLVIGYGLYQARKSPRVVEVRIPITGLPAGLEGFRLVQISDLHAGETIGRAFVRRVVARVNALEADVIAFTGDVADGSVKQLHAVVAPLAGLSARYGKFFVTGNHEYYSGAAPWLHEMESLGFTVLLNQSEVRLCQGCKILFAGVTDFSAAHLIPEHRSDPARALAQATPCDLKILLAHQPRSIFAAAQHDCDVQLSGHTHGGQFLPWNWLVPLQQPYVAGLYKHEKTWLYVNRGAGYWGPPLRIGAPSEITLIKLATA